MKKLCWTIATLVIGLALIGSPASAQSNVSCTGTLAAGTYNVVTVPAGQTCTLNSGVTVLANVTVGAGGSLTATGATIDGSVAAKNAASVSIGNTTIGVNVQLVGTTGLIDIFQSNIGGSVQIVGRTTPAIMSVTVDSNVVTGSVTLVNNVSVGNEVDNNTIGINLSCVGNSPAPKDGSPAKPNTVGGSKTGQCAGL